MEVEIGVGLIRLADPRRGGDLLERIQRVRQNVAADLGIILPKVRIRDNMRLEQNQYRIKIADMPVAEGAVHPNKFLAMDSGATTGKVSGLAAKDPAFGAPAVWIERGAREQAEMFGYTVVESGSVIATHLTETVRRHADEIITRDAAKHLIDELKRTSPTVVDELIPGVMKLAEVQQILQMLLRESVPIRQLGAILETLGDYGTRTRDPILLTEYVRHRLARTICSRYRNQDNRLFVATLDPALEDRIRAGFDHNDKGMLIRMSPQAVEMTCRLIAGGGRAADDGQPSAGAPGQPADPRGAEANDFAAPAAVGGAQLQRDHPRHEDRIGRHGFRREMKRRRRAGGQFFARMRPMELKTFRASTMHEALAMVERELGADAAVLHTREISLPRMVRLAWRPADDRSHRLVRRQRPQPAGRRCAEQADEACGGLFVDEEASARPAMRSAAAGTGAGPIERVAGHGEAVVPPLRRRTPRPARGTLPPLHRPAGLRPQRGRVARELVDRVRAESRGARLDDLLLAKTRIARMIEAEIAVAGPIQLTPGRSRLVALVGPTGVGKTTTIAKLAAQYRLRDKRRVGLITVDTYRIAAVEQLRTYADIIDLPMQVVSTPREMREAVRRMSDLDLILLDTAGRSPKDDVRIQELRGVRQRGRRRRGSPRPQRHDRGAIASADRRAVFGRRRHGPDSHQARRGIQPGKPPFAAPLQQAAAELPDQWAKRARRHRNRQCPAAGAADPGHGAGGRGTRGVKRTNRERAEQGDPNVYDQANHLRELVKACATSADGAKDRRPNAAAVRAARALGRRLGRACSFLAKEKLVPWFFVHRLESPTAAPPLPEGNSGVAFIMEKSPFTAKDGERIESCPAVSR